MTNYLPHTSILMFLFLEAEEVKSPSRAEKRPIDSTITDADSGSCANAVGLQVTGAPVPLFVAQDSSTATSTANISVQAHTCDVLASSSNQTSTGLNYQPLLTANLSTTTTTSGATSATCSNFSGQHVQV